jgi:serine protease Do
MSDSTSPVSNTQPVSEQASENRYQPETEKQVQNQTYQQETNQQSQSQTYQNMTGQQDQSQTYQTGYGQQNQNMAGQNDQNRTYNWQTTQENGFQTNGTVGTEPVHEKKEKKSGGLGRKVAGITAAALLFGTVAGGTMVGINTAAGKFQKQANVQVSSQTAVTEAPASTTVPTVGSNVAGANTAVALDVSAIVKEAMPSVVAINNTMLYKSSTWWGQSQTYEVPSSGSGIIIGQNDDELLIATNNHVVEDSDNLSVVFIDETSVNATIRGTDSDADLAVISVALKDIPEDTLSQITVAKLGDSDEMEVGQGVIAIGNALGYGQSVTVGYVSALDREVKVEDSVTRNLLQTDAAINPGNSGGALLNMKGEVIGINAAKYSSTSVEGIGYAIPISKAQDILNTLMSKRTNVVEEGKEGYLGIQGLTVDDNMVKQLDMPAGVFVYGIIEGGAAANSDLREKDIITKFDGQTVKSMAALQELLKSYSAGETVDVTVKSVENGEYVERTVSITLGEKATLGQNAQSGSGSKKQGATSN